MARTVKSAECKITSRERVVVGSRLTGTDIIWVTFVGIRKRIFPLLGK